MNDYERTFRTMKKSLGTKPQKKRRKNLTTQKVTKKIEHNLAFMFYMKNIKIHHISKRKQDEERIENT